MKKIYTLIIATAIVVQVNAQKIIVEEIKHTFSQGNVSSFKLTAPHVQAKQLDNAWKEWLKKNMGIVSKVKDTYFSDNTAVKELGNNTVDIYTNIYDKKSNGAELIASFDFDGKYITCDDMRDKCQIIKGILSKLAFELANQNLLEKLNDDNNKFGKFNDKQKKLEENHSDHKSDIEKTKLKIEKTKNDLQFNEQALTKKADEVTIQKRVVDASAGAVNEQAESAKKIYDKLSKEQLRLEKEIKNLKNENISYLERINKLESKIKDNESEQSEMKSKISTQKDGIEKIKTSLDQIKL